MSRANYTTKVVDQRGTALIIRVDPNNNRTLPSNYTAEKQTDGTLLIKEAYGRERRLSKNAHDLRDAITAAFKRGII